MNDRDLIRRYASGEKSAFEQLVRRHLDWVYGVCRRRVREEDLARDVTQAVFIALAKKAQMLARHTSLSGWLYQAALYCSRDALKRQRIREKHERAAGQAMWERKRSSMTVQQDQPNAEQVEAALAKLGRKDRELL